MRIGIFLRNFGTPATADTLAGCARIAEDIGIDDLWLSDHIAIPAEESEGSGGVYLDPLATLGFLAGVTERIGLGTSVLIVPYRQALICAKLLASIQLLSGERLSIGAAVGWMEAEFRAAGVDRHRRGVITDETLAFWHDCFSNDEVELNGQRFLFKPRPKRPPFLIGGAAPHALKRAAALGDGWMPTEGDPEKLREPVAELTMMMKERGKPAPLVVPLTGLPLDDNAATVDRLQGLDAVGVTGIDHAGKYETIDQFRTVAGQLLELKDRAGV